MKTYIFTGKGYFSFKEGNIFDTGLKCKLGNLIYQSDKKIEPYVTYNIIETSPIRRIEGIIVTTSRKEALKLLKIIKI